MIALEKLSVATAGAALISLGTIAPIAAASLYSVTELPFRPSDINDVGQIVGDRYFWNNGTVTDLSSLPGVVDDRFFVANAINNNGMIVGFFGEYYFSEQAFISDGTTITILSPPSADICGGGDSCANILPDDINDAGKIVVRGFPPPIGFRYGANGLLRDSEGSFTNLFSGRYVFDMAINNSSAIIGNVALAGEQRSLFVNNGTTTQLFASDPSRSYPYNYQMPATATDLNDLGQVVGFGATEGLFSPIRTLFWNDPENNPIAIGLGSLGGSFGGYGNEISKANGINNASQIVGYSYSPNNTQLAFLWENGNMFDLNRSIAPDLGWELSDAVEINNKGQIVGYGFLNGQARGFLLTPVSTSVPEPTSVFSLLAFGVFGIAGLKKRSSAEKDRLI